MAVLFNAPGGADNGPAEWRAALARLDPDLDFRIWPDSGPVEEIEFAIVWHPEPGDLRRYPNLKAIFNLGAGVDALLKDRSLPAGVPIVRLVDRGLTIGMTEYVLLHVLRYHRDLPTFEAQQRRREWAPHPSPLPWRRRVGILGLGVLGGDAATKLAGLGFDVAGWSRTPKALPGVEGFIGATGLVPFLGRSEILVCLLPLTAATTGILDARTLAALPRGAAVINAARGGHVVEADLLAALESGQVGHATLDVFAAEPLPPDHPFWTHSRVTVTPHVASLTVPETAAEGIVDGMRRARAGQPLLHVVDPAQGY